MIPISICIICKNEEKNMDEFLSGIVTVTRAKGYPVEILVADTGSTDNTISIAEKYADTILHFKWINDFSAARNFSIQHAKYEWILVLDCDELIQEWDMDTTQLLMQSFPKNLGRLTRNNHYTMNETDCIYTDQVMRLFPKSYYHYEHPIHEQLLALDHSFLYCFDFPLIVDHTGYIGSEEELIQKAERNNQLLFQELEKHPKDPYVYFQIGQSYNLINDYENARIYYEKGIALSPDPKLEYTLMMVEAFGNILINTDHAEEALRLEAWYPHYQNDSGFLCTMGRIYLYNNMPIKAVSEFVKATAIPTCRVNGSNSFIPRYNIGCINEMLGDAESALKLYQSCGDYEPALIRIKALTE